MPSRTLLTTLAVVAVTGALSAVAASPAHAARPGAHGLTGVDPNRIVGSDNSLVSTAHIPLPPAPFVPGFKGTGADTDAGGGAAPLAIIGSDDRFRVTQFIHPATTMVKLLRPGLTDCSGFMISADTVATAGHCVYSDLTKSWVTGIVAIPAPDGSRQPYGSCTARALYSVVGWTRDEDPQYDYGVVKLACMDMGFRTGWLGFGWTAESLLNAGVTVQGYPTDKPANTQWSGFGHVLGESNFQLFHSVDTAHGNSGSPLYGQLFSCYPCAMGIQAYGLYGGSSLNRATRINLEVFGNLVAFTTL